MDLKEVKEAAQMAWEAEKQWHAQMEKAQQELIGGDCLKRDT